MTNVRYVNDNVPEKSFFRSFQGPFVGDGEIPDQVGNDTVGCRGTTAKGLEKPPVGSAMTVLQDIDRVGGENKVDVGLAVQLLAGNIGDRKERDDFDIIPR